MNFIVIDVISNMLIDYFATLFRVTGITYLSDSFLKLSDESL